MGSEQNLNCIGKTEWIRCPVCGDKTRDKLGEDTILINYPLYCPKYDKIHSGIR